MIIIIAILVIAYLIIAMIIAKKMEEVAALKGYGDDVHAFAMCFWLGIIGCIYVTALPDKIQQSQNQRIITLLENQQNEKM